MLNLGEYLKMNFPTFDWVETEFKLDDEDSYDADPRKFDYYLTVSFDRFYDNYSMVMTHKKYNHQQIVQSIDLESVNYNLTRVMLLGF